LQSGSAERTSGIFSGDTSSLFVNRKERGSELFMTRFTFILGIAFFLISLIAMFV
jgi:protein translocase SecG subunit